MNAVLNDAPTIVLDASDEQIKASSIAFLETSRLEAVKELRLGDATYLADEHFAALNSAVGWLSHFAEQECDCELTETNGTRNLADPSNHCSTCASRNAIERILRVTEPNLETMHPERMRGRSMTEKIYVETWREENERRPWRNHGNITIEAILNPDLDKPPGRVTPHDMRVVTTFVQWLGTNCGQSFLDRCERKIEEDRVAFRQLELDAKDAKPAHHQEIIDMAKAIAAQWIADHHYFSRDELTRQIVGLVMRYYGGRKEPEPQTTAGQRFFDLRGTS